VRSSRPPIFLPLLLIGIGGYLLLRNFGYLPDVDLLQFWPVVLVLAGLQALLRGDIGLSWQAAPFGVSRGTVRAGVIEVHSGELDVKLRALRREGRLIAGVYTARSRPALEVRGDTARLTMHRGATWPFSLADWEIGLAKDLPWTILIGATLGEIDIDLRGVMLNRVDLGSGIGDVRAVLTENISGSVRAHSTLGNVTLSVPEGVEAVIRVRPGPFARVQIDERRFLRLAPNLYATLHYADAEKLVYAEGYTTFGAIRLVQTQA